MIDATVPELLHQPRGQPGPTVHASQVSYIGGHLGPTFHDSQFSYIGGHHVPTVNVSQVSYIVGHHGPTVHIRSGQLYRWSAWSYSSYQVRSVI